MSTFFNPWSLGCVVLATLLCFFLYRGMRSKKERLLGIGSFVQQVSVLVSLIYAVHWLSSLTSIQQIGPKLSFTLVTIIYGLLVNIIIKLYVRITSDDQYVIFR